MTDSHTYNDEAKTNGFVGYADEYTWPSVQAHTRVFCSVIHTKWYICVFNTIWKTITIKEKYNISSGSGKSLHITNTVMDENANVYKLSNSVFLLHFTSAEVMMKLEKDKQYVVKGYGWRVPFLGMYPNIVSANLVK